MTTSSGGRTHREIRTLLAGIMLGMLLPAMTMTIVATALPTIVSDLGGLSDMSWLVTAYMLAAIVSVPLVGKASDMLGRRPLFQGAIGLFVVGSLLCGLAPSMGYLIAARVVQGAAGGSLMALSQATIGDIVPARQRGRYQGYIGAVFAVATLAGPLVGGVLVDALSWRWVFYVNIPLGLIALVATHRYLHISHERRRAKVDYLGALLVATGIVGIVLVGVWGGQEYEWTSPVILSLVSMALVCIVLLIPVERRAPEPIVPLKLFTEQVFTIGSILSFVLGAALFSAVMFTPTFLQVVTGISPTTSGLMLLPITGGFLVSNTISGRLITRWGRYKAFPVAGTLLLLTGFVLLSTMDPNTTLFEASAFLAIVGLGAGFTMQVVIVVIQNAVNIRDLGIATSAAQLSRMIGATLGLAAFGASVNLRLATSVNARLPDGLPDALKLDEIASDPVAIAALPSGLESILREGLAEAITFSFLLSAPLLIIGLAMAAVLRDLPLDNTTSSEPRSPIIAGASPSGAESRGQSGACRCDTTVDGPVPSAALDDASIELSRKADE